MILNGLDFAHKLWLGGASTSNPPNDPLSLQLTDFSRDLNVNTVSPFVAAQQAAAGFAQLPASASKTFIYTGNILNTVIIPSLLDLGVGKTATAHIIQSAAGAYQDRGFKYAHPHYLVSKQLTIYRFYYADQRKADGKAVYSAIDGDAHAELFLELAEGKLQGPWQQTFVSGTGYKDFGTS